MNWEIVQNIAVSIGSMIAAVVIGLITFKKKMDDYFDHKKTNVPGKIIKQSDVDNKILTKMEHIALLYLKKNGTDLNPKGK